MTALLLSDATASAALSRLLHDWTGCAIPPTADTPESEVEELVPLAVSILRRHWQTPLTCLGSQPNGNTGVDPLDLADLFRQLIGDRVQGNEAMCIPPVHDNIPAAVAALRERKIGGVPEAPDGLSLPRILCDSSIANTITELIDDNIGWTAAVDGGVRLMSALPNAKSVVLGCKVVTGRLFTSNNLEHLSLPALELQEDGYLIEGNLPNIEDLTIDVVQIKSTSNWTQSILRNNSTTKILRLPRLKYMTNNIGAKGLDSSKLLVYECSGIEEIYAPNLEEFCSNPNGAGGIASTAPNLRKVVVGNIRIWHCQYTQPYFFDNYRATKYPNLLHLEFASLDCSLNLSNWTATNVISDPAFLSNFRLYIADRLSDNGSGKTLTLSQEVRDAIHSAGIDTIITNKGWTISPVPTQQ